MVAYTREKIAYLLRVDFVRFCLVGGTGFVINFILLTVLTRALHMPTFPAQLIGAEIALFSNFMLHHHWTYKRHHVNKSFTSLIVQFHATSWPAIIGSTFMVTAGERFLHLNSLAALGVSSAIALAWNFVWSKFVIWKGTPASEIREIAE